MRNSVRFSTRVLHRILVAAALFLPTTTVAAAIPDSNQEAAKTLAALIEVGNQTNTVPNSEKFRRVREAADRIDAILPLMTDPSEMMKAAGTVLEFGGNQDVNALEYWGDDPMTRAHFKPLAGAVVKLFAAASHVAAKRALELSKFDQKVKANVDAFEAMDDVAHGAAFSRNMSVYFECLATSAYAYIDPKTKAVLTPEKARQMTARNEPIITLRKSMADEAIAALKEFDDPASTIQPRIRIMIGKLHMAAGDYKKARETFVTVYTDNTTVVPAPTPFEQYDARYSAIVAELLGGDLAGATQHKRMLDAWQSGKLPGLLKGLNLDDATIKKQLDGATAAAEMLQWRLLVLAADLAQNPAARKSANAVADAALMRLRAVHPEFATSVDLQVALRTPTDTKIDNTTVSSLLMALLKKGKIETYKEAPEQPDKAVLNKAVEAAQAILRNRNRQDAKGDNEFTSRNISDAEISIATLREALGDNIGAANAYLDFAVDRYAVEPISSDDALNRAGDILFNKLAKLQDKPQGYMTLYDRFLPIAIGPPFNHTNAAYLYADVLCDRRQFEDAIKYYRLVPRSSPAYGRVDYKIMRAMYAMLKPDNPKRLDEAARKKTIEELKTLAASVKKLGDNSKDDIERRRAAMASLILTDLAQRERNPDRPMLELPSESPSLPTPSSP